MTTQQPKRMRGQVDPEPSYNYWLRQMDEDARRQEARNKRIFYVAILVIGFLFGTLWAPELNHSVGFAGCVGLGLAFAVVMFIECV